MKKLLAFIILLVILFCVGCATPHDYNDPIDPNQVTIDELASHAEHLEVLYQKNHQVEGIIWQAIRSDPSLKDPDQYGSGGDSCIFGGHKLATDVFHYATMGGTKNLDKALQSLRGLYILTHVTGTPGVFARAAFPAHRKEEWCYPENWQHRIDNGFVHEGPSLEDPFNPGHSITPMIYYTRATKDQLTGLLFGLAVAWEYLEDGPFVEDEDSEKIDHAKIVIATIVEDVYNHLRAYCFSIRDEKGENDTNADDVNGLMLLQLLSLYKETVHISNPPRARRIYDKYQDQFNSGFFVAGDLFNGWNNYSQYYAWNLRYLRGYTVYLLDGDPIHRKKIRKWYDNRLWQFTKNHLNAKFIYFYNAVTKKDENLDDALFAMKSLKLKPIRSYNSPLAGDERKPSFIQVAFGDWDRFILSPHLRKATSYSTWQKEPWDVGGTGYIGRENTTGVDFMLSYWMGRYYKFISAPQ
jgi:hypothetical protein